MFITELIWNSRESVIGEFSMNPTTWASSIIESSRRWLSFRICSIIQHGAWYRWVNQEQDHGTYHHVWGVFINGFLEWPCLCHWFRVSILLESISMSKWIVAKAISSECWYKVFHKAENVDTEIVCHISI